MVRHGDGSSVTCPCRAAVRTSKDALNFNAFVPLSFGLGFTRLCYFFSFGNVSFDFVYYILICLIISGTAFHSLHAFKFNLVKFVAVER